MHDVQLHMLKILSCFLINAATPKWVTLDVLVLINEFSILNSFKFATRQPVQKKTSISLYMVYAVSMNIHAVWKCRDAQQIRNKVIKKFYYKGRNISVYDYKSQPWLHLKNGGGIGTYITLTSEAPFI